MTGIVDTHCHLSGLSEDELQEVLAEAKNFGLETLIAIGAGYGFDDNPKTLEIAKRFDHIFCALGMHPHDAKDVNDENFEQLKAWYETEDKVKAVGEIGLDYHYMHSEKKVQIEVLERFASLAKDLDKPVVIHDRDAGFDCVDTIQKVGLSKGVAHCFTGSTELAKRYLDLGFYISFSGVITFKNAEEIRDVVRHVPIEKTLVETDSPFMTPAPHRGKKNQPGFTKFVAEKVAEVKGLSFEEVAQKTTENAKRLFEL